MLRYYATAAVLGIGWFIPLSIPSTTREWLFADSDALLNALCLAAASILIAVALRQFIEGASTFWQHLLRATVIPYAGCFVYLTLYAVVLWSRSLLGHGLANVHDTMSLFYMGMLAAVFSFFVVIPYGLLCQYCLSAVARKE